MYLEVLVDDTVLPKSNDSFVPAKIEDGWTVEVRPEQLKSLATIELHGAEILKEACLAFEKEDLKMLEKYLRFDISGWMKVHDEEDFIRYLLMNHSVMDIMNARWEMATGQPQVGQVWKNKVNGSRHVIIRTDGDRAELLGSKETTILNVNLVMRRFERTNKTVDLSDVFGAVRKDDHPKAEISSCAGEVPEDGDDGCSWLMHRFMHRN